jgi:hypoxia up-regulated 1
VSQAMRYPKNAFRYLLDVLGKQFDNPQVDLYRRRFPFYELEKDPETGMVLFKHEEYVTYFSCN